MSKKDGLPPRMRKIGHAFYHVSHHYDENGKSVRPNVPLGSDRAKALTKWAEIEGSNCPSPLGTFGYCIERYIRDILPEKTPKTQRNYLRSAKAITAAFGKVQTTGIKPMHIYKYMDGHPKPLVANGDIKLMSVVFSYAMRWGECSINPCRGVRRHSEPPRDRYIEDFELQEFITAASPSMKVIIELAYITAMRKGDLLGIMISDVKPDGLYVRQGKTGKRQIFEWSPELRRIVAEARALPRRVHTMYLFTSRNGTPYSSDGFDSNWQRIMKRTGIAGVHFHDIRGKSITDAKAASGIDNAQALAGHKNSSMTEQYIRSRGVQKVTPLK